MKIKNEIRIAILGIAAIVTFILGFNYLKGSGLFSSTRVVKAEYDDVQGLTPSSFVQIKGFKVGAVKSLSLSKNNPGKILVEMNIDKNIPIPVDSRAIIVTLDLLGTKAINLKKGEATQMVNEDGVIKGELELGAIESISASLQPAIENVKNTLASLDTTVHSINKILDESTQKNIKHAVAKLDNTMSDFSQFSGELNAQKNKITSLLNNLNGFADNLNKNNQTINKVLSNAETTTQNLSKVNFENTVQEIKSTLQDLQSILEKVNSGNGSMAMLLNDDKLYRNLKNTLATANNLLYDINARPSRYINVNIFGKKHKNECPPQVAPNSND